MLYVSELPSLTNFNWSSFATYFWAMPINSNLTVSFFALDFRWKRIWTWLLTPCYDGFEDVKKWQKTEEKKQQQKKTRVSYDVIHQTVELYHHHLKTTKKNNNKILLSFSHTLSLTKKKDIHILCTDKKKQITKQSKQRRLKASLY